MSSTEVVYPLFSLAAVAGVAGVEGVTALTVVFVNFEYVTFKYRMRKCVPKRLPRIPRPAPGVEPSDKSGRSQLRPFGVRENLSLL